MKNRLTYKSNSNAGFFFGLAFLGFIGYGYIMNVIYLAQMESLTGMTILRSIGLFLPPVGIIMGYI